MGIKIQNYVRSIEPIYVQYHNSSQHTSANTCEFCNGFILALKNEAVIVAICTTASHLQSSVQNPQTYISKYCSPYLLIHHPLKEYLSHLSDIYRASGHVRR